MSYVGSANDTTESGIREAKRRSPHLLKTDSIWTSNVEVRLGTGILSGEDTGIGPFRMEGVAAGVIVEICDSVCR